MRLSTGVVAGDGKEGFSRTLRGFFPGGKAAIICTDKSAGKDLGKALGDNYTTYVFGIGETERLPEDVRFLIGFGNYTVVSEVKKLAENRKFAFYSTAFDYSFLYGGEGNELLPEFVYLDENVDNVDSREFVLRLYSALFCLCSEGLYKVLYTSAMPYRDKGMKGLCDSAKKVLDGETDKSTFVTESLRLITALCNAFYESKTALITQKMAKKYSFAPCERFLSAYFADLFIVNFTKRRFRDILLPSEEPTSSLESTFLNEAFDGDLFFTSEELTRYARTARSLKELPTADRRLLTKILYESVDESNPLFAGIKNQGIMEGLYYERLKGN